ncbi:helix-turn-helix domain-containing protein [uncultured Algoriphagus sp.]|uniref:helix-turn-helix domain-containing protein n=1 Tax=uncultured Algoriphagus sp. TaxID=417365 RepID=UPI00259278C2|nr:helix-turn-helix domain-containing protein [uncultured Algoriphagus sp.]
MKTSPVGFVLLNELQDILRLLFPPKEVRERMKEKTSVAAILALLSPVLFVLSVIFSTPGYTETIPIGAIGAASIASVGFGLALFVALVMFVLIPALAYALVKWFKGVETPDSAYVLALFLVVGTIGYADRYVMLEGAEIKAVHLAGNVEVANTDHPYSSQIRAAKLDELNAKQRISWCSVHGKMGKVDAPTLSLSCPVHGCHSIAISQKVNKYNRSIWASVQADIADAKQRQTDYDQQGRGIISQRIGAATDNNNLVATNRDRLEKAGKAISTWLYIGQFMNALFCCAFLVSYYNQEDFKAITEANDLPDEEEGTEESSPSPTPIDRIKGLLRKPEPEVHSPSIGFHQKHHIKKEQNDAELREIAKGLLGLLDKDRTNDGHLSSGQDNGTGQDRTGGQPKDGKDGQRIVLHRNFTQTDADEGREAIQERKADRISLAKKLRAEGFTHKEIAERMGVSAKTVSRYLKALGLSLLIAVILPSCSYHTCSFEESTEFNPTAGCQACIDELASVRGMHYEQANQVVKRVERRHPRRQKMHSFEQGKYFAPRRRPDPD